ncbi:hypothetical protein [Roseibium suaedae]|uniref:ABM domain-containing protein n=1 Tax=Roseibium suaedae TaxID=735517 RepID=A0A1M7CMR3_9HYPH|nr:hypothetical protein [Roseibium suaedae]SHL68472.1 hypothetical protein SAMN05444272_1213 [Roseibium suaedae]
MTATQSPASPCLELVIYRIKNPTDAAKARRAAQDAISQYEGFLSWAAWESEDDAKVFADVAMWESLEAAKAAGERLRSDPVFGAFISALDGIISMSHYRLDRQVEAATANLRKAG